MAFSVKRDFLAALALPGGTRREKTQRMQEIQSGESILQAIVDEPDIYLVDDGPVDPDDPTGPHNSHEIPMPNPMWQRFGFSGKDDAQVMLNRFQEVS
jgi:hypothetical protein